MEAPLDGAGSQLTIHAEAFACGAQQLQQRDDEGVQAQEAIAALRIGNSQRALPIPKRRSLLSRKLGSIWIVLSPIAKP